MHGRVHCPVFAGAITSCAALFPPLFFELLPGLLLVFHVFPFPSELLFNFTLNPHPAALELLAFATTCLARADAPPPIFPALSMSRLKTLRKPARAFANDEAARALSVRLTLFPPVVYRSCLFACFCCA